MNGLTLTSVQRELQRLRQGEALGRPADVLRLSPELRSHITGSADEGASDVVDVISAIRRAISGLTRHQAEYALVDLNLTPQHSYPTLTARQESLASSMSCAAKTVRRRADSAMESLALSLVTGTAGQAALVADSSLDSEGAARAARASELGKGDWRSVVAEFWSLAPQARIDVVCSEIPAEEQPEYAAPSDRNYLRYAKFADLDGLIYVRSQLAQVEPDAHVRDFAPSEHHGDDADTLIVIGGPPWNAKYREFLPHLPYFFEPHALGEDDPLVVPQLENLRLGPRWSPRGDLLSDIAVVTRLTLVQGTTVALLGGCLTLGVLGAAKCFLHREYGAANIDYLQSLVGTQDVVVVTYINRVGDIADVPDFSVAPPLLVLARQPRGKFTVVVNNTETDALMPSRDGVA